MAAIYEDAIKRLLQESRAVRMSRRNDGERRPVVEPKPTRVLLIREDYEGEVVPSQQACRVIQMGAGIDGRWRRERHTHCAKPRRPSRTTIRRTAH